MGVFSEYLSNNNLKSFQSITEERKKQLKKISEIRKRPVLAILSDQSLKPEKKTAPVAIDYTDLIPVEDQIDNLSGDSIDVILETPGGSAERAEDIVKMLRRKFGFVSFIVPGAARSAGTIMVMSGDEILLSPDSSLGPIDAQIQMSGKWFSAEAFLKQFEKIKEEVEKTGNLNKAYIPILSNISPGEIQACQNAQDFSKSLVTDWLKEWKFRTWDKHSSTGSPVTAKDKTDRASTIGDELCDHSKWLTHGRSIKMADLETMRLKITDYTENKDLADAIKRYYTLAMMTFESSTIYKIFETPDTQIYRSLVIGGPIPPQVGIAEIAQIDFECPRCKNKSRIQANLGKKKPIEQGSIAFPSDNKFKCPNCNLDVDLSGLRKQIESQQKKPIV
jgi:hypothetical protein